MLSDAEASLAYMQVVKVAGVSLWALFREKKVTLPKFIVHIDSMLSRLQVYPTVHQTCGIAALLNCVNYMMRRRSHGTERVAYTPC